MKVSPVRLFASSAVVGTMVAAGMAGLGHASAKHSQAQNWVTTKGKAVNLTLVAAYNTSAAGGFNFNGGANGKLVVTVPLGDTVNVTFSNKATIPHSAQVVAFSKTPPATTVADAFKGAHTANPTQGITAGKTQKFSFVANKAGTYLVICAVPGHASAGMWDTLVVAKSAKAASAVLKK